LDENQLVLVQEEEVEDEDEASLKE